MEKSSLAVNGNCWQERSPEIILYGGMQSVGFVNRAVWTGNWDFSHFPARPKFEFSSHYADAHLDNSWATSCKSFTYLLDLTWIFTVCEAGYYGDLDLTGQCTRCEPGTYSEKGEAVTRRDCKPCGDSTTTIRELGGTAIEDCRKYTSI